MQTHQPTRRYPRSRPIGFHAVTWPQWFMALVIVLVAAFASWLALKAEIARRETAMDDLAVPVLAPDPAISGGDAEAEPASGSERGQGSRTQVTATVAGAEAPDGAAVSGQLAQTTAPQPSVLVRPVAADPFAEYRLERERWRSRQTDGLQAIVHDPAASQEQRGQAQERLLALWAAEALEVQIENMLRVQGYRALVLVSETGAHVVVDGVLDSVQAQAIGELVSRVAGVRREAVSIVDAASAGR